MINDHQNDCIVQAGVWNRNVWGVEPQFQHFNRNSDICTSIPTMCLGHGATKMISIIILTFTEIHFSQLLEV